MRDKQKPLWRPQASFNMMNVDNDNFMVKFDSAMDREKVIGGGLGCFLTIILQLKSGLWFSTLVRSVLVERWCGLRFWGSDLLYYHANSLKVIVAGTGCPIGVDLVTNQVERGKFVCIYVEVDLNLLTV